MSYADEINNKIQECLDKVNQNINKIEESKTKLNQLAFHSDNDNCSMDNVLDLYNAIAYVCKTMALLHSIEATMLKIKLENPNKLNDNDFAKSIEDTFYAYDAIPDLVKEYAKDRLHIFMNKDFNPEEYIKDKMKEIQDISNMSDNHINYITEENI